MPRLLSSHLGFQEASCKSEVADEVEKLVSRTLIGETKNQIAEVAILPDFKSRNIEQLAHVLYLLRSHRMLDNHNRIVDISSLDKPVLEQELDLMEEDKCPADTDFFCVNNRRVPLGMFW